MILRYPAYYEKFQCIAGKCEDTCCAGWEIDIDDESYERYQQVSGAFGMRIKESMKEYTSEEDVYERHGFRLKEGKRCPFLNQENLCDMILALGEQSLCYVCTHTPRNYFEYDGAREISLSPSCPEAGRLIFSEKQGVHFLEKESEEEFALEESDEEIRMAKWLRRVRDVAVFLLQRRVANGRQKKISERLCEFLLFAEQVQERWNQERTEDIFTFSEEVLQGKWDSFFEAEVKKAASKKEYLFYQGFCRRMDFFSSLECINEDWAHALERINFLFPQETSEKKYLSLMERFHTYIEEMELEYLYEQLVVYYAFLMLPRALDDENFRGKAQFVAVSFLMVRDMDLVVFLKNMETFSPEDFMKNARFYAKEMEHSEDNMELAEEEFLFEEEYQVKNLIAQFCVL